MKEIREAQRAALGKALDELLVIAGELEDAGLYANADAVRYARTSLSDTARKVEFLREGAGV